MIMFKHKTKVAAANNTSISKRTSIPAPIAQMLHLEVGDSIEWIASMDDNKLTITVEKSE